MDRLDVESPEDPACPGGIRRWLIGIEGSREGSVESVIVRNFWKHSRLDDVSNESRLVERRNEPGGKDEAMMSRHIM
jgi:hypothetical protein